jgi:hypothetical protein
MGDWWWDTQNQFPAGVTFVPVICASSKTHFTNLSSDKHPWLLYLMIGNIRQVIQQTPKQHTWILVRLIPCPPKHAKNIDDSWHNTF